jgi:hypothetical protein
VFAIPILETDGRPFRTANCIVVEPALGYEVDMDMILMDHGIDILYAYFCKLSR